jgi:hypothetical protein
LSYSTVKIQYGIEDQLNPDTLDQAARDARKRFGYKENVPNLPYLKFIKNEKRWERLLKQCDNTKDSCEQYFELKATKKYIYRQGGKFSMAQLITKLPEYFETVHVDQDPGDEWLAAASYLASLCQPWQFNGEEMIEKSPRHLYNFWKGDHRSIGGLTFLGDRRTPGVASYAIKTAIAAPYNIDPTIAGMRLKDNKYRNIFMDSFANYYREAMFLHHLFERWEEMPFDSNEGDLYLAKKILKYQAKSCQGKDYKAMDQHHSYDATVKALICVSQWFNIPYSQIMKIVFWFKDLFEQAVLVGDELWVPDDMVNFLSGLYPTHDLEGMVNVLIHTRTLMDFGYRIVVEPRPLRPGEAAIVVCGDDSIVLLGDTKIDDKYGERLSVRAAEFGQIVADDKDECSHDIAFFCKKGYALRFDVKGFKQIQFDGEMICVPKYSLKKALNSIYHPENYPTWETDPERIAWFAMIYDNAFGDKMWKSVLKTIFDQNRDIFTYANLLESQQLHKKPEFVAKIKADWWMSKTFSEGLLTKSYTIAQLFEFVQTDRN